MLPSLPSDESVPPVRLSETFLAEVKAPAPLRPLPSALSDTAATFTRNSLLSVGRLFASTLIALVLPAYLAHKLPVKTYSAWVLILQMSAFVGYLDFGVQTGVAKYVAEYKARNDDAGANLRASAGLAIMIGAAILGVLLTLLLAWRVPRFFVAMPSSFFPDVRLSLILVGCSLSFGLLCSVPAAIFLGLQRYAIPTALTLLDRVLYTLVILVAVHFRWSLATMGALVALIRMLTSLLQVVAWRRLAGHVRLSLRALHPAVVRQMLAYCSVLAIWTLGMLCVSGLDLTIVGRYDFPQTAFYAIATAPTNFLIAILGAAIGPLLPTASALSALSSPASMGTLLARLTRYAIILLLLSGLPLLVGGHWILTLWVGRTYALHAVQYLRILVLANMIRNIGLPYATMLVATESQKFAIAGATAEAVINVAASIYLARHIGALGVALGTLLGSFVSVAMHFAVGMHYTYSKFRISRARLFFAGVLRPALSALPTLLCTRLWWSQSASAHAPAVWVIWGASTLLLAWFIGLRAAERSKLLGLSKRYIGAAAA